MSLNKYGLSACLALLSLSTTVSAQECCQPSSCGCNRIYIGGFGGELFADSSRGKQQGTAFFDEEESGGPLTIDAQGKTRTEDAGFGGAQVGYEWTDCPFSFGCSDWTLTPGAELEAFWYGHKRNGHFLNRTDTDRIPEHDFADSFKLDHTVVLANFVLSFNNPCFCAFTPYVGGGIGATHISLTHADSLQIAPPELGVNHFNSGRSDTTWAFAAQVKAGLSYDICNAFRIFGEYRYLFVDTSNYILGSTVYSTHVHTTQWNVQLKGTSYNAFAFGVQYDL